nr:ecto-NOX disulfide-thiol exchanger 1-like [Leptinotarsa decemlineata]
MFGGALNDAPLEFTKRNTKSADDKDDSSQSPSDKRSRSTGKSSRDRRDTEKSYDSDSNMSSSQDVISIASGPSLGGPNMWGGMMGMGYPMVGMNMLMDPSMLPMNNYGMIPPMLAPDPSMIPADPALMMNPVKEIIHCKSCTLFPPNPNAPLPTTRERPPGCRTVFVGGLPENMTEEIITEIFER